MDDWEAEDFIPPPPVILREQPKSPWEDEDAGEEEPVKQSWEDEDNESAEAAAKPKPEKKKAVESKGKKQTATLQDDRLADPLAEKLRQQRLVEEADYQSTTELFGRKAGDRTLDNFIPKSEEDFIEYAELVAHKIRPFEKSFHYLMFVKAVMRHAVTSLKASAAKELASSMTVTANEKLRIEKEAAGGKKKPGPKRIQLLVDKADDGFAGTYDEVDEYDFM